MENSVQEGCCPVLDEQKYLEEWYSLRKQCSVGKLDTYTKIKCNFGFEKYLNSENFALRRDITRFRISSHRLNIEIGRYARIERADRLCTKCSLGVLGDEIHFLLACPTFNCDREPLINLANGKCGNFAEMDDFTKFFRLLNCEDVTIMRKLAYFVHVNLDK